MVRGALGGGAVGVVATGTGAVGTGAGGATGSNPFGGRGDWRPSLFVSDVPEVDYFGEPEAAGS